MKYHPHRTNKTIEAQNYFFLVNRNSLANTSNTALGKNKTPHSISIWKSTADSLIPKQESHDSAQICRTQFIFPLKIKITSKKAYGDAQQL